MKIPHLRPSERDFACSILDSLANAAPTEAGHSARWVDLSELSLGAGYDYQYALGLLRLLAAFGLLELNRRTCSARVTSVNGGYMLRMLSDLLDCNAPLVLGWDGEGDADQKGQPRPMLDALALLARFEQRRLELLPDAAPVRNVEAAYGILTELRDGERAFLLCFDAAARAWQVPGGRYEHRDRSLRATLLRELEEELGVGPLQDERELLLTALPERIRGTRLSPSNGLLTCTVFHFFLVAWVGPVPLRSDAVRWVSERELRARRSDDGQLVSAEPLVELLDHGALAPALLTLPAHSWRRRRDSRQV